MKLSTIVEPALIKFSGTLAFIAAVISLIFSLISGSSWLTVIVRPFAYGLIMALVSAIIFFLLKIKVPEAIAGFSNDTNLADGNTEISESQSENEKQSDLSENRKAASSSESAGSENYSAPPDSTDGIIDDRELFSEKARIHAKTASKKMNQTAHEGEILVEGVRLKNQPGVMAEAIKHLIDLDKE